MDLFYDDIGASIDAVIVHVEAAIQATRCNPTFFSADAIEQSHRASGILSTLLNFNFFKRSPHAILSTCAEALHVASSQMQLRVSKCPSAHPIDDVPSHCIDQYTTDELVLPDRENIKYNLSDIIGNDTAKASHLKHLPLSKLTKL